MTKKIYLETFKKCPGSLCFTLLVTRYFPPTDVSHLSFIPSTQPLPREVEGFPRGDKHFKHVPLPTYLIYLSPKDLCR